MYSTPARYMCFMTGPSEVDRPEWAGFGGKQSEEEIISTREPRDISRSPLLLALEASLAWYRATVSRSHPPKAGRRRAQCPQHQDRKCSLTIVPYSTSHALRPSKTRGTPSRTCLQKRELGRFGALARSNFVPRVSTSSSSLLSSFFTSQLIVCSTHRSQHGSIPLQRLLP